MFAAARSKSLVQKWCTEILATLSSIQQVVDSRNYTCTTLKEDIYSVLNPDKSQLVIFSNRNNTYTNIIFQNIAISASSSFSLLGIGINCRLFWTDYVRTVCNRALRKMGLLYKTRQYFNSNQLSTIYKSHIRSQMEYCSPLCNRAGHTVLGMLDKLKNCTIRLINERRN